MQRLGFIDSPLPHESTTESVRTRSLQSVLQEDANQQLEADSFSIGARPFKNPDDSISPQSKHRNFRGLPYPNSELVATTTSRRLAAGSPNGRWYQPRDSQELPEDVDWVVAGAIGPVLNQGACGSCWAFTATAAMAAALFIADGGPLQQLSEEELVACDTSNYGCDGGNVASAFDSVARSSGISSSSMYPYSRSTYKGNQPSCVGECAPVMKVNGYYLVQKDELSLQAAVTQQPVSVGIDASSKDFQFYKGGILNSPSCGTKITHAVLAVGYGITASGQAYWLLKNSWGKGWGEAGYLRLQRGVDMCGIVKSYPTFPYGPTPVTSNSTTQCMTPKSASWIAWTIIAIIIMVVLGIAGFSLMLLYTKWRNSRVVGSSHVSGHEDSQYLQPMAQSIKD